MPEGQPLQPHYRRVLSKNKRMNRFLWAGLNGLLVALLLACSSAPAPSPLIASEPTPTGGEPHATEVLPGVIVQAKSRWTPVHWNELPGFDDDALFEAWNAWLKSCERPAAAFAPLCGEVRRLSIGSAQEQRAWLLERLQPYRVETSAGGTEGLLTAYFEPVLVAALSASADFPVPLYQPPLGLMQRKPWYTRQEMD